MTSDLQISNPQVNVEINRDKVAALGLTAQQIEDALYYAYGSRQVSTIFAPTNQYQVIMELDPQYQVDPAALAMLYIRSDTGQLVPLDTVATISKDLGPLAVNHLGQLPAVTISFNLKPGVALGDAVTAGRQAGRETLAPDHHHQFPGHRPGLPVLTSGAMAAADHGHPGHLHRARYSLRELYPPDHHPLRAAGRRFRGADHPDDLPQGSEIYAFVGIIMLIGIVKKNAIMMIDFALEAERKEGKEPLDAIYQGAIVRFRPIMMTTMAALMGTLPIAMGFGAGAEVAPAAGSCGGGRSGVSQLLTLYITPVVYYYMEKFQTLLGARRLRNRKVSVQPVVE